MVNDGTHEQDISFRSLRRVDFPLLQSWLGAPHVAIWWNERFDLSGIESKYGPRIDGRDPVHVYLIEQGGIPIGWIQWYRWRDFPDHASQLGATHACAGIDLAIGYFEKTGAGLGSAALLKFATGHIFANADIKAIVADPAANNQRSVNAFKRAGFYVIDTVRLDGESFERRVVRLDRH